MVEYGFLAGYEESFEAFIHFGALRGFFSNKTDVDNFLF